MSAAQAVALIKNGDTVGLIGGGGGLLEADGIYAALEASFRATDEPRDLTVVHALGSGDKKARGMNRFAHEGLVRRVIGGHWVWSPRMQQLARDEKIEAYVLPGGVVTQLFREIGAGRPGLLTHVGLGTFVDPRIEGGKMNRRATDDLVELIELGGEKYLRYKPFPVNVAIIRGSAADGQGNVSLDQEAANLDAYAVALAAHNSGGKVIVQVGKGVGIGMLPARSVRIPGAIVDAVVVDPTQCQTYDTLYDPALSGESRAEPLPVMAQKIFGPRQIVARRAAEELRAGAVINYGIGFPDAVAKLIVERGHTDHYYQTIEHGIYGGEMLDGSSFGISRNPTCIIDSPAQFDFYSGGGLDIAFLGFGEFDRQGNVNVSKLGGTTVGPGGFIDIAQNARKVVFCGNFSTKGAEVGTGDGFLRILRQGDVWKAVADVEQITFSGPQAIRQGQEVLYVTERAVFKLTEAGVELLEIAPGIDLQRDVIEQMGFSPILRWPIKTIDSNYFTV